LKHHAARLAQNGFDGGGEAADGLTLLGNFLGATRGG